MIDFLGTAFLIGNKGFALTAGHVLPKNSLHKLAGMFVIQDKWHCFLVKQQEECVDADVALLEMQDGPTRSPFRCRNRWEGSSARYRQFGYPRNVVWELAPNEESRVMPRSLS